MDNVLTQIGVQSGAKIVTVKSMLIGKAKRMN